LISRHHVNHFKEPPMTRRLAVFALLTLTAIAATVTAQEAAPSAEVTIYPGDIHNDSEGPLAGAPLAMTMVAPRGGAASAKVVVRSPAAIAGLKANVTDLKQDGATIPATQFAVRYGVRWETTISSNSRPRGCDILLESPPPSVPAVERGPALASVWVTVQVPRDAKPGAYAGQLTVEAQGLKSTVVPVMVTVSPWAVPETRDWRTWIELVQSPDTLALEYNVPLWSEKHWQMIARSFDHIGRVGSRVVYIPLICGTNQGNAESMVRWTRKPDGTYTHDFSVMDRYLDLAVKHMGTPKYVVFYAWEVSLKPPEEEVVVKEGDTDYIRMEKQKAAARYALKDRGPAVSLLDPSTGQVAPHHLPKYTDPAGRAAWEPVWKALREKMAARGLEKAMLVGVASDAQPSKDEMQALVAITGGLPWTTCSHHARWVNAPTPTSKSELHGLAPVEYAAVALDFQYTFNPAKSRSYGWKKPVLHAIYWRFQHFNTTLTPAGIRNEAECNITGNQRGIGHLGADFWPTVRGKTDARVGTVADRYPESYWHSLNIGGWMLGRGPDGPTATARYEFLREGVQECEARIAIESVLTDATLKAKLGDDLAARAQKLLDERQIALWKARGATDDAFDQGLITQYRDIYNYTRAWKASDGTAWFIASKWQDRAAALFAMAAEVETKAK
jgi:hypothetical protein